MKSSIVMVNTKTKRTPETLAKIMVALTKGCPMNTAALSAGVTEATVRQWMAEDEDIAVQFSIAQAGSEMTDVDLIDEVIKGDDKKLAVSVAQWRRSRLNPAVWGQSSRNDSYERDQKIKELVEELRREGLDISEAQVLKELKQMETKALPSGFKK